MVPAPCLHVADRPVLRPGPSPHPHRAAGPRRRVPRRRPRPGGRLGVGDGRRRRRHADPGDRRHRVHGLGRGGGRPPAPRRLTLPPDPRGSPTGAPGVSCCPVAVAPRARAAVEAARRTGVETLDGMTRHRANPAPTRHRTPDPARWPPRAHRHGSIPPDPGARGPRRGPADATGWSRRGHRRPRPPSRPSAPPCPRRPAPSPACPRPARRRPRRRRRRARSAGPAPGRHGHRRGAHRGHRAPDHVPRRHRERPGRPARRPAPGPARPRRAPVRDAGQPARRARHRRRAPRLRHRRRRPRPGRRRAVERVDPAEPGSPAMLPEPTRTVAVRLALVAPTGSAGPSVRSLEVLADEVPTGPRTDAAARQLPGLRHPRGARRRHHRQRAPHRAERPVRRAARRGARSRPTAAATTACASAPTPAAARRCRCGTSARGTPRTTTGTRRPSASRGRTCPQGRPQAQAAFENKHNGGRDGFGRQVKNPAGIDLADGTFWGLGLTDNAFVTVDYLWTARVGALGRAVNGGAGPVVERAPRTPRRRLRRRRRRRPGRAPVPARRQPRDRHPGHAATCGCARGPTATSRPRRSRARPRCLPCT